MDLSFAVRKLDSNPSNPDKVHFEGLLNLLRCIRVNTTLGLKYYSKTKDAPLSELLRQSFIKTENMLMIYSDSKCQYCTDTGRSTGVFLLLLVPS